MNPDADLTQIGVARILADRVGRLVLASCEAFDNFPPKPARPAVMLCRIPGGGWVFTKMLGTRFFRHNRKTYGALGKRGIPDAVYDQWFRPAAENRAIRRDLVKSARAHRRAVFSWSGRMDCRRSPSPF